MNYWMRALFNSADKSNTTKILILVLPFIEATIADSGCGCRPQKKLAVCKNTNIGQTHLLLSVTFLGNAFVRVKSCFQCSHHRKRNCNDHCIVRVRAWSDHYQFCGRSAALPLHCHCIATTLPLICHNAECDDPPLGGSYGRKKIGGIWCVYILNITYYVFNSTTHVYSLTWNIAPKKITLFPLHTSRWR